MCMTMKWTAAIFLTGCSLIFSCGSKDNHQGQLAYLTPGEWRGVLKASTVEIPFLFEVEHSGENLKIILKNAEDRIPLDDIVLTKDSIHVRMFIYDATIHTRVSEGRLHGVYVKDFLDDFVMPFEATYGDTPRFESKDASGIHRFSGKWEVDFLTDNGATKAIGMFDQFGDHIKGTFLTATGDYRFLEGAVDGDSLMLSCFDGTYIYLFKAALNEQGNLEGDFWSGKSWHQKWVATRNDNFELPDPYSFTFMNEGYEKFEIKFPNSSGDLVELTDDKYKGKAVVVQIMGTWCPNCMDETKFYVDWIKKNPNSGVEFIGLAFERKPEAAYAFERILKMKEKLEVPYEVLLAGTTSQESRTQALPMLNKIFSFPTSIILDRQHKVRKIHTGFSGPGTGAYYEKYVDDFNLLMDKLTNESIE